ncbi:MAG: antitoxin family protein [Planctomycetes bacterium]|nr:antitoxin family protein [Planctomycetota bacterium]
MTKTIHAIYKQGLLKPLEPIEGIKENAEVEITISVGDAGESRILKFAGILSDDEANRMLQTVEEEFERIDMNEWKD